MRRKKLPYKEFKAIFSKVPRLCVDLVIKDSSGRILLTKRAIKPYLEKWHFPGGSVLFHETVEEAVKRVAKEELNVKVKPIKLLGFIEVLRESGSKRHAVSLAILTKIVSGKIALDRQASNFKFVKDIPENTVTPHKRFILKNVL